MGLVIYDGNDSNYEILNKNYNNQNKIELISVKSNEFDTVIDTVKEIKPKVKKIYKKNALNKENKEFINSLKSGSGFKILPKQV